MCLRIFKVSLSGYQQMCLLFARCSWISRQHVSCANVRICISLSTRFFDCLKGLLHLAPDRQLGLHQGRVNTGHNVYVAINLYLVATRMLRWLLDSWKHLCFAELHTGTIILGLRGGAVGWGTALQAGRSRVRLPMRSLEFFIDIILPTAPWPCGRPSL